MARTWFSRCAAAQSGLVRDPAWAWKPERAREQWPDVQIPTRRARVLRFWSHKALAAFLATVEAADWHVGFCHSAAGRWYAVARRARKRVARIAESITITPGRVEVSRVALVNTWTGTRY